jgi:hypothetical protein
MSLAGDGLHRGLSLVGDSAARQRFEKYLGIYSQRFLLVYRINGSTRFPSRICNRLPAPETAPARD